MSGLQRVSPTLPSNSVDSRAKVVLPPTPAWSVVLIPGKWQIMMDDSGAAWVVPDPIFVRHLRGVGGVAQRRQRRSDGSAFMAADPSQVLEFWRSQGGIPVPVEYPCIAHGETHDSWLHAYKVPNGVHHCWAFELPVPSPGRAMVRTDQTAKCHLYASWGLDFMGGKPPAYVLAAMQARDEQRRANAESRARNNPVAAMALKSITARMGAMGWLVGVDANVGQLERAANGGALATTPPEVAHYLSTLTPEARAALVGLGGGGIATASRVPVAAVASDSSALPDESSGEVVL